MRKQYDRSGRLWVQQALFAHPEFVVVPEGASAPGEVDLYETIYGTKNFAPQKPGVPMFSEAVIARCKDAETCAQLGGMFQAVSPADHPLLACKEPKATTGGFARVKELAAKHLVPPDAKGPAAALCARAVACSAHLPGPPGDAPCKGVSAESLKKCAPLETCEKVVACFGETGEMMDEDSAAECCGVALGTKPEEIPIP